MNIQEIIDDIRAMRENKYGRYGYDEESQVDFNDDRDNVVWVDFGNVQTI